MSWLELDDRILDHPKFIRVVNLGGSEAVHLWLGMRAYCGQLLTDGAIPDDMLNEVRGPKDHRKRAAALAALIEVGLLDRTPTGVAMHDYLEWSSSRDDVVVRRQSARDRKRRQRGTDGGVTEASGRDGDVTTVGVTDPRARGSSPLHTTPIHTTPDGQAPGSPFWTATQWRDRFGRAWCDKYQRIAYGGGDADSKATGDLADQLAAMPDVERRSAQEHSAAMFREFLADETPAVIKARHPWSWLVARFQGLLVPAREAPKKAEGPYYPKLASTQQGEPPPPGWRKARP